LDRQRIDKWMWHARVVRTRSAAASLVDSGLVRINGVRCDAVSRSVRPADVITVALDRNVRILKVLGYVERRGSADIAKALFEDLTPPPAPKPEVPESGTREDGAGRPTKKERRQIDRLQGWDEERD
jgi:ribosome-associated heat shock protein Hsp15